jgi:hypothetical protein
MLAEARGLRGFSTTSRPALRAATCGGRARPDASGRISAHPRTVFFSTMRICAVIAYLDDLRADHGVMDVVDADDEVIGEAPAPIAVVADNGPSATATPSPSNTAMSVWPLAAALLDWEVWHDQ